VASSALACHCAARRAITPHSRRPEREIRSRPHTRLAPACWPLSRPQPRPRSAGATCGDDSGGSMGTSSSPSSTPPASSSAATSDSMRCHSRDRTPALRKTALRERRDASLLRACAGVVALQNRWSGIAQSRRGARCESRRARLAPTHDLPDEIAMPPPRWRSRSGLPKGPDAARTPATAPTSSGTASSREMPTTAPRLPEGAGLHTCQRSTGQLSRRRDMLSAISGQRAER